VKEDVMPGQARIDPTRGEQIWDRASILALFDPGTGTLDRRVLSDEALYRLELERIFARGWNFMCHDSQIPNPGDYFINYIGEDQMICVRDDDGAVNVLLNTCRHRGNALCRAEQARSIAGSAGGRMCCAAKARASASPGATCSSTRP
jgi:hypothetical protein